MEERKEKCQKEISKKAIRGAIQYDCFNSKLSMRNIAKKYHVNLSTVQYWKKRDSVDNGVRKRRSKLDSKHIEFILNLAKNKFSGIDRASSRIIAYKVSKEFRNSTKKDGKQFKVSAMTVNRLLQKHFGKPRKARKIFKMTPKNIEQRIKFIDYIHENNIKGEDIFFTDESRFLLDTPLNKQTNQFRLPKEDQILLREGNPEIESKIAREIPKFSTGFMVAGGISYFGPGKLIFCVGTMDTVSYKRTINHYKDDIRRLNNNLYFQQDNASCHTSKESKTFISENMNFLEKWPANSPDLNPIEKIWAILKERLSDTKHKTLEELKSHLVYLWNRIPVGLCKKLAKRFNTQMKIAKDTGQRCDRILKKKRKLVIRKEWTDKWNTDNEDDTIERVVFNNKTLEINKKRAIKVIEKRISIENKRWRNEKKEYTIVKLREAKLIGYSRWQQLKNRKLSRENIHKTALKFLEDKLQNTKEMSLNEWYESLNNTIKLNMIKFQPVTSKEFLRSDLYSTQETQATENLHNVIEEDEDEEIFDE